MGSGHQKKSSYAACQWQRGQECCRRGSIPLPLDEHYLRLNCRDTIAAV